MTAIGPLPFPPDVVMRLALDWAYDHARSANALLEPAAQLVVPPPGAEHMGVIGVPLVETIVMIRRWRLWARAQLTVAGINGDTGEHIGSCATGL
jgi:hypothetical protein